MKGTWKWLTDSTITESFCHYRGMGGQAIAERERKRRFSEKEVRTSWEREREIPENLWTVCKRGLGGTREDSPKGGGSDQG